MTTGEAKALLVAYYKKKEKPNWYSFLITRNLTTTISITELLEPWQKEANLALPSNIELNGSFINEEGVKLPAQFVSWKDVFLTAVVQQSTYNGRRDKLKREYFFAGCLNNGETFEIAVTDIGKYSNLLGHFIEQYKQGQ